MKVINSKRVLASTLVLVLSFSPIVWAQEVPNFSFILGTVYEVDKPRYRRYIESLRAANPDLDETAIELDASRFLDERAEVAVAARQLTSNQEFTSPTTGGAGEYTIRDAPPGTFEFELRHDGVDYAVRQRLDVNVELSYVAELCFVIDREEQVAWMVSDGPRRGDDVPPWVPRECRSALSACLAMLTGTDGRLPDGLLLLLAGGAATVLGLGITSIDQTEASDPTRR